MYYSYYINNAEEENRMNTLNKGDYVEQVMWHRFDDNGYATLPSKAHYMTGRSKTICGVNLPSRNEAECQGTHHIVDCKICRKIFEKMELNCE